MPQRFGERIGVLSPKTELQLNDIDTALRSSLWNVLYMHFETDKYDRWKSLAKGLQFDFFKKPVDELPNYNFENRNYLKAKFFQLGWIYAYEMLEETIKIYEKNRGSAGRFIEDCNFVLERDMSGYRIINGLFAPITSESERSSIEEAVRETKKYGLFGAQEHLITSVEKFSDRVKPDYRNSIKESISAIESICKQITGSKGDGLAATLRELSSDTGIHGALESAFIKLYGYTSDEDGIRHAILESKDIGFDEDKFMLVSCSAFVNYLIVKAEKGGLLKV